MLSLPFKVIFAFAPPPNFAGGWPCFVTALVLIGGLTALIGDLATHVGCCLGLLPAVTAITFVAMGTSLPDTFASKQVRVRVRVKVRISASAPKESRMSVGGG